MKNQTIVEYQLVDYWDVWGNEDDGYEVNDVARLGNVFLADNSDADDVIDVLIKISFLSIWEKNKYHVEWRDEDFIEISHGDDYKPICRLEKQRYPGEYDYQEFIRWIAS